MPDGWPGTEVGWGIVRSHWRRGYAAEAAVAAIDWAFANLGWTEVIHIIDVDNVASQAVARKLGSRNGGRGRMPPPYEKVVVDVWRQSRDERAARRHS
jgi:RimJ/RimL family protein N-acetyltransferase